MVLWPWLYQYLIIPSHNQIQHNLNIHQDRNYLHKSRIIKRVIAINVIKVVIIHVFVSLILIKIPIIRVLPAPPFSGSAGSPHQPEMENCVKDQLFSDFPRSKPSRLWSLPSPPRSQKVKDGPQHHCQDHLEVVEGDKELRIAILVAGCGEKVFPGSPSDWEHWYKWYAWSWSKEKEAKKRLLPKGRFSERMVEKVLARCRHFG